MADRQLRYLLCGPCRGLPEGRPPGPSSSPSPGYPRRPGPRRTPGGAGTPADKVLLIRLPGWTSRSSSRRGGPTREPRPSADPSGPPPGDRRPQFAARRAAELFTASRSAIDEPAVRRHWIQVDRVARGHPQIGPGQIGDDDWALPMRLRSSADRPVLAQSAIAARTVVCRAELSRLAPGFRDGPGPPWPAAEAPDQGSLHSRS